MLLSLILAAAPVTIALTPEAVMVDGAPIPVSFDDAFLNLPPLEEALRRRRTDAGPLEVRVQVAPTVPFARLARVMFSAAAAGSVTQEVAVGAAEPFRQATGRSLGVLRLTRDGLTAGGVFLAPDAGSPPTDVLTRALGPVSDDGVALISVEPSVPASAIAVVSQACRRAGYQVALTPDPNARPDPGPSMVAPLAGSSTSGLGGPVVLGSLDKELIRKVIHANRGQVRACYEKLLATRADAVGKVSVKFVISATGDVSTAEVAENAIGDDALGQCLSKAVKTWKFPSPRGGGVVIVTYPFIFKQG